jgi:hypothetical protein
MLGGAGLRTRRRVAKERSGEERDERRLRRAVAAAAVLLCGQLVAMLSISWVIFHRWSNTWDYAIRYQGWWGIAHGNLDPFSSVVGRSFIQDHFEVINWPLAPLSLLWPHGLWPLWIQDLMVIGAEVGAVFIVLDALRRGQWSQRIPGWVAVAFVSVLLVANPWIYESIAFDFHYQTVGAACFALLACREMMSGSNRRLVLWSILCLACGDLAGTYLAAVGLGGILAGGPQRRRGTKLLVAGILWVIFVTLLGANQGSQFVRHYGYLAGAAPGATVGVAAILKGVLTDPGRGLGHLWSQRVDLWAYASSAGLIGFLTPWAVLPILVLLENGLGSGTGITGTAYENFGAVLFLIPLSVLALGRIDRRLMALGRRVDPAAQEGLDRPNAVGHPRLASIGPAFLVLLLCYAVAWGAIWIPHVPPRWVTVSPSTAATLDRVERLVPPDAEVVASQGVIGRFADRRWLYRFSRGGSFPLQTPDTYFVIVPTQGIELATIQEAEGLIGKLAGSLHGRLLVQQAGVWLFELHRTSGVTTVVMPERVTTLPAWIGRTVTGTKVLVGPVDSWHVAQQQEGPGYLLRAIKWQEQPGTYAMTTTIDNRSPVDIEVWDASTDMLLSRRHVGPSDGDVTVRTEVTVTQEQHGQPYSGVGPLRFQPTRPPPGDRIEIRIVTPGTAPVSVYDVELTRTTA